MDKLKICLISLTISPDIQDGSAKFFRGIFNYLKSKHHDVQLITGLWNYDLHEEGLYQIKVVKKSYLWVPQFIFKTLKFLQDKSFDIMHCNGPKGTLPLLFKKTLPFISTIHDLGPLETPQSSILIEKFLIQQVIKKSTLITTCSESIKEEIAQYFPTVESSKIHNLYSAIENKFRPHPQEAKELKEKMEIDGPIILYIGRITKYKGIEDLINAYTIVKRKIKNLSLVIGGVPDFSMEKIYNYWKKKYQDIYFLGYVPDNQLPWYYSMADIFVTCSIAGEGFGLTPIEAIACGTPVICSSLRTYKEVLEDNAVYVDLHNPEQLAKRILDLLEDNDKRMNLINKAMQFITRYSWNFVGEKLEKVYELYLNSLNEGELIAC
ncbi:MAG: glycosyltransferase family 4 protein [Promethearchaeota archaeon]